MKRWRNLTFVSAALVIVNIAVFFVSSLPGKQLLSLGDLNLYSVMADREYYRVLTAMFLHADMQHLFNNMLILFFLGNMIEEKVGHVWYGFFFFLSGIGGNLASLWLKFRTNDPVGSIGASGVVFGLDGACPGTFFGQPDGTCDGEESRVDDFPVPVFRLYGAQY